jgi:hypothetical protein
MEERYSRYALILARTSSIHGLTERQDHGRDAARVLIIGCNLLFRRLARLYYHPDSL